MMIGIISDTHGSTKAWRDALAGPFQGADQIWHCGDFLYHGARNPLPEGYNTQELAELLNSCPIPVLAVRGNCDSEVDQMVLNVALQSPFFLAEHAGGRVLVTHGHHYGPEMIAQMAQLYQIKLWISGHTHEPVLEERNGTIFLNPGSSSLPKGEKPRRSVALLRPDAVELFDLDDNAVYKRLEF
ncbi:MAG: phosphodiesterase [Firmicutes bacterium]|jgi:putative phosphoesterase|nr:phosphodiesterase [Bacillota bacterium]NLO66591.1 phosphodiesterase [Bacillota bacterium]